MLYDYLIPKNDCSKYYNTPVVQLEFQIFCPIKYISIQYNSTTLCSGDVHCGTHKYFIIYLKILLPKLHWKLRELFVIIKHAIDKKWKKKINDNYFFNLDWAKRFGDAQAVRRNIQIDTDEVSGNDETVRKLPQIGYYFCNIIKLIWQINHGKCPTMSLLHGWIEWAEVDYNAIVFYLTSTTPPPPLIAEENLKFTRDTVATLYIWQWFPIFLDSSAPL